MWPPQNWCEFGNDIQAAADAINRPHEDYPLRVSRTVDMIYGLALRTVPSVSRADVLAIQGYIMWDYPDRGRYRDGYVIVGGSRPPGPEKIRGLMDDLLPRRFCDASELKKFYIEFEEIHPFSDGNGRTGGVVLAAIHHILYSTYLVSGV